MVLAINIEELHLTEGRGTGIPTIHKVMANNGSPRAILETDDQCTHFLTVLPIHTDFNSQDYDQGDDEIIEVGDQDSVQDSVQDSDQGSVRVYPKILLVIRYCLKAKTREGILAHIGLTNHTKNYKKYILPAINNKWITMTIPGKPTSKNQKYKTTNKGRKLIETS